MSFPRRFGAVLRAILFLAVVAHLLPMAQARGTTWVVPASAPTIQSAVGLAAAGDTIAVQPGTYTGPGNQNVSFGGKNLVLRSTSGAASIIIDCLGSARGLVFENGEENAAAVEGFTIRNGLAAQGGAVLCHGTSPTIVDCVLTANRANESGGGIAIRIGAKPRIVRCRIEGNSAFLSGGGISCIDASATIVDCDFTGNEAGLLGAGIYCRNASPSIDASRFVGNRSNGAGGGLVIYHLSAPVVTACVVSGNRSAGSAGAVFCDDAAAPTFVDCVVTGNYTDGNGGGILCVGRATARIEGSTLSGNRALQKGGGLYAENVSGFTVERSIVWGNCAASDDEVHLFDAASPASFTCTDVDSSGVGGAGIANYAADVLFGDPKFCGPLDCIAAPASGGDHTLDAGSPCLSSSCAARIGALGLGCGVSGVPPDFTTRARLRLSPQPFRERLRIEYSADVRGPVRVTVHDVLGRHVRSFAPSTRDGALDWDGTDAAGRAAPSGTYFIRLSGAGSEWNARAVRIR